MGACSPLAAVSRTSLCYPFFVPLQTPTACADLQWLQAAVFQNWCSKFGCTSKGASQKSLKLAAVGSWVSRERAGQGKSAFHTRVLTDVVMAGVDKMLQLLENAADLQTWVVYKCRHFSLSGKGVPWVKNLVWFHTAACLLATTSWQYPWRDEKPDLKQTRLPPVNLFCYLWKVI